MNMIGRISGREWTLAPSDATHVRVDNLAELFYKKKEGVWYYFQYEGWHISLESDTPYFRIVSREEDLNRIGKSGVDWSYAPEGTTHITRDARFWRKIENNRVLAYLESKEEWALTGAPNYPKYYISKEEDLAVQKQKTINDIEVGMFLRYGEAKSSRVVLQVGKEGISTAYLPENRTCYSVLSKSYLINLGWKWSYTFDGPYTPFAPIETEEDKKIKELQATIEEAKKQIDQLVKDRGEKS